MDLTLDGKPGDGNGVGCGNHDGGDDGGEMNATATLDSKITPTNNGVGPRTCGGGGDENAEAVVSRQHSAHKDRDPIEDRNILIVGKTGSGKATIANHIFGRNMFEVSRAVDGITRSVSNRETRSHNHSESKIRYNIRLVDTIGVSDGKLHQQPIIDAIKSFIHEFPSGIHLVLFVCKNARFTREDRDPFSFLLRLFSEEISAISALIITCCEGLEESAQKELVHDFINGESTKNISRHMELGLHTVGFPNLDTVKADLKVTYKASMEADATMLRALIAGCKEMKLSGTKFQQICSHWRNPSFFNRSAGKSDNCVIA